MKLRLIIVLALLGLGSVHSYAELPEEAKELLGKLSNWELDRQAELQKEIRAKRSEVATVLEKLLESTTKNGDLDGALAIKSEIEKLKPIKEEPDQATVSTESSKIPRAAHRGRKSYYLWIDEAKTWSEAKLACEALGGNLVSINNEDEWEEVLEYRLKAGGGGKRFWIGLLRPGDATTPFEWADGSDATFLSWGDSQPNPGKTGAIGVQVASGSGWFAYLQSEENTGTQAFICEWPRK